MVVRKNRKIEITMYLLAREVAAMADLPSAESEVHTSMQLFHIAAGAATRFEIPIH